MPTTENGECWVVYAGIGCARKAIILTLDDTSFKEKICEMIN